MRICLITGLLLLAGLAKSASAQGVEPEEPEANPGRPTVSTPASITPVDYLQFETGTLAANHSPEFSSRYGLNEVIKYAPVARLELLASAEPIAHFTTDGNTANRVADIFVGAQAVITQGEGSGPTIAASYFHRAYDGGAPELDYGSPTNSCLLLASADVKGFHYDANAMLNELEDGMVRRAQFGQSLSISHHLAGKFSLSGEVWHFSQPLIAGNAVGNLWAVGYNASKILVLDGGFDRGLTGTSTRWEVFVGFTYLLPHKLFRK